jgi:hypothetical protein
MSEKSPFARWVRFIEAGVSEFGEESMIELVLTVGYYCLICHTLNTFQVPLEPGMEDPFPGEPNP